MMAAMVAAMVAAALGAAALPESRGGGTVPMFAATIDVDPGTSLHDALALGRAARKTAPGHGAVRLRLGTGRHDLSGGGLTLGAVELPTALHCCLAPCRAVRPMAGERAADLPMCPPAGGQWHGVRGVARRSHQRRDGSPPVRLRRCPSHPAASRVGQIIAAAHLIPSNPQQSRPPTQ